MGLLPLEFTDCLQVNEFLEHRDLEQGFSRPFNPLETPENVPSTMYKLLDVLENDLEYPEEAQVHI